MRTAIPRAFSSPSAPSPRAHPDRDDVTVADEGTAILQIRERVAAAGHQREILAGGGTDGVRVARMPKVAVRIDEDEPVATTAAEREHVSQQDAAVTAKHDRKRAAIEQRRQTVGQTQRETLDRQLVAHAVARFPLRVVPRRHHNTTVDGREPLEEPFVAQRAGELVDAGDRAGRRRPQAEVRRRIEDDDLSLALAL